MARLNRRRKRTDKERVEMRTKMILQPDGWWDIIPIEFEIPVPTSNNVFITKIDDLLEIIDSVKEEQ